MARKKKFTIKPIVIKKAPSALSTKLGSSARKVKNNLNLSGAIKNLAKVPKIR